MACDISELAQSGSQFNSLDILEYQAAKVYLLAQILKELTGQDYTDLTTLALQMTKYTNLPAYAQRSAELQVLVNEAVEVGVPLITPEQFRSVVGLGHCLPPDTLQKAETFLWCTLLSLQRGNQE